MNKDTIRLHGRLKIYKVFPETGVEVCVVDKKNYITQNALYMLPQLVSLVEFFTDTALTETKKLRIHSLRMGTSNIPTDAAQSNLVTPITGLKLLEGDFALGTAVPNVVITKILDVGEGNGNTFREAALFTKGEYASEAATVTAPEVANPDGVMFSRLVHSDLPKTVDFQLRYVWAITFGRR